MLSKLFDRLAARHLGLGKLEYDYLRRLISLNNQSLALWIEIEEGDWDERIPSELRETLQDLVDAECLDSVFNGKLLETEACLKTAIELADRHGLTELGDRLRRVMEVKRWH